MIDGRKRIPWLNFRKRPQRKNAQVQTLEERVLFMGPGVAIDPVSLQSGASNVAVVVHLTDTASIQTAGIGVSNIAVTGPFGPLTVAADQVTVSGSGTQVDVSYFVSAPNGIWDQRANGSYTITFEPNQVVDAAGAAAPSATAHFDVSVTAATAPLAAVTQPAFLNVTVPGTTAQTLEVTYSDPAGIDLSSLSGANLISFASPLNIKLLSVDSQEAGKVVHATYSMGAPRGAFFPQDNTGYHVATTSTAADAVKNVNGVAVVGGALLALYEVGINPTDLSFGFANTTGSAFVPEASGRQSNGDLIVAGHAGNTFTGASRVELERFKPDGTLDSSFGNNGVVLGSIGNNEAAFAMIVKANDQILIGGTSARQFLVEQLNADGSPDLQFGGNGTGAVDATVGRFPSSEIVDALALSPDGSVVAAGQSDGQWAFARFTAAGVLINSFLLPQADNLAGTVGAVAVQGDSQIVAAGSDGTVVDVARVSPQGTLDANFNGGAVLALTNLAVRGDLPYLDHSIGLALDGSAIVVASRTPSSPGKFAVQRLSGVGLPDPTFGSANGLVTTDLGGDAGANAVLVTPTGQIVVSGKKTDASGTHDVSVTYNSDGSVNTPPVVNPPPPVVPPPTFSVSGTLFNDLNGDGVQESGEAGLAARTVYADVNGSGSVAGEPQGVTDVSGNYTISGLTAGTYQLREVLPGGWTQTFPANGAGRSVMISNANVAGVNFGEVQPQSVAPPTGAIAGAVFDALSGAFLPNISVTLNGGAVTTTTDASGRYVFSGLAPGNYTVAEIPPASLSTSTPAATVAVSANGATAGPVFQNLPTPAAGSAAPDLVGAFRALPSANWLAGARQKVTLRLRNVGNARALGVPSIALFLATSSTLNSGQAPIATVALKRLNLRPGGFTDVSLRFTVPSVLSAGQYYLLASIDDGNVIAESNKANNVVASPPVMVAAPFASLSATLAAPATVTSGKATTLTLSIMNAGNIAATARAIVNLYISSASSLAAGAVPFETLALRVSVKAGRKAAYRLRWKLPSGASAAGSRFLIAKLSAPSAAAQTNLDGLTATSSIDVLA